jgi:hypothetical protein
MVCEQRVGVDDQAAVRIEVMRRMVKIGMFRMMGSWRCIS